MPAQAPIVVATDLSPAADEAIRQADARARMLCANLVACHVIPNLFQSAPLFPQRNMGSELALPALREAALAAVTGRQPGDFQVLVDDGNP